MGFFTDTLPSSPAPSTYSDLSDTDIDEWGCNDWQIYYQRNENLFGRKKSNEIIGVDFANTSFFTSSVSLCKFNCAWRKFFLDKGFEGSFLDNIFCGVTGTVESVVGGAESLAKGAEKTAKIVKFLLPAVLIGGTIFLATNKKARKKLFG